MLFVIGLLFPIFLSASSFSMSMDCPSTVKLGDTVSCTIKANIDNTITGVSGKFSFGSTSFDSFTVKMSGLSTNISNESGFSLGNVDGLSGSNGTSFTVGILKVKIPASSTTNEFTVKVTDVSATNTDFDDIEQKSGLSKTMRVASSNADLESLSVDGMNLSPSFKADVFSYKLPETYENSIKISAKASDSNAKVSGDGTKSLKYGTNTFTITVTSESGSTQKYTIKIDKVDNRDSNNLLKSLSVKDYDITPKFDMLTSEYKLKVEPNVKSITIDAEIYSGTSKFKSKYGPRTVSLKYGKNDVKVIVIAENELERTYTITVTRQDDRDSNNYLSKLEVENKKLIFDKKVNKYPLNVLMDVTEINIIAEAESSKAKVTGAGVKKLKPGKNEFTIKVTAENETVNKYVLTVNRLEELPPEDTVPFITSFKIKNAKSELVFDANTTSYDVKIADKDKELDFDISVSSGVTAKISGNENLENGSVVRVTVSDGFESREYSITIKKDEVKKEAEQLPTTKKKSNNTLLFIIIGIVPLVIAGVVFLIIKTKKNEEETNNVNNENNENNAEANNTEEAQSEETAPAENQGNGDSITTRTLLDAESDHPMMQIEISNAPKPAEVEPEPVVEEEQGPIDLSYSRVSNVDTVDVPVTQDDNNLSIMTKGIGRMGSAVYVDNTVKDDKYAQLDLEIAELEAQEASRQTVSPAPVEYTEVAPVVEPVQEVPVAPVVQEVPAQPVAPVASPIEAVQPVAPVAPVAPVQPVADTTQIGQPM